MKLLNLINNERQFKLKAVNKACQNDGCQHIDRAFCTTNAIDICKYDYAACYNHGIDVCLETDHSVCAIGKDYT